jgi:hypothetical protein
MVANSGIKKVIALICAPFLLWAGDLAAQVAKTTTYSYDALGRLTYVNDSVNGNRDFDYDAAGNRRLVAVGTANDPAAEPGLAPPAKPISLTSQYMYSCAWAAGWTAPAGETITSYKFKDVSNPTQTLSASVLNATVSCDSPNPSNNKPKWVQACNASGCSEQAFFP